MALLKGQLWQLKSTCPQEIVVWILDIHRATVFPVSAAQEDVAYLRTLPVSFTGTLQA